MTDLEIPSAGSGECTITIDGARIRIVGDVRTSGDREQLRTAAEHVLKTLELDPPTDIAIDLTAAKYVDVATLTCLLGIVRRSASTGHAVVVEGASAEFVDLLAVTRIDQVFGRYGARVVARPAA